MAMKVEVEQKDQFTAKIHLEIPSEQATQEYNKAWRRLGQRLNIPGFRRGKAPRAMVEKTVGVDRIKQEAMDRLLPHAFADAISENQLDIVAPPQIENFKFDLSEGIHVDASVEIRPEAKLPKLEGFKVEVEAFKTPSDAMDQELEAIVSRMTTLEPVIDRAVGKEDIVNIDFNGFVDGEAIKGGSARNYRLDIGQSNFIEGFADQIVGHKLSEEFSINVTFPKDYHDKALAGKDAEFKIKINEINEKVTPELNDELAKKLGEYDSLDALKKHIDEVLKDNEAQENDFRKQKAIVENLIENSKVEIPDSMINRETNLLRQEMQERFKSQGINWDQFVKTDAGKDADSNLRGEAIKRIKTSLVFGAVAKQEDITVSDEEFSAQVKELAEMRGVDEKNIMRHLGNNVAAAQALSDQVLSQKVVDFLIERTEFKVVDEKPAKKDDKAKKSDKKSSSKTKVAEAIEGEEFDSLDDDA